MKKRRKKIALFILGVIALLAIISVVVPLLTPGWISKSYGDYELFITNSSDIYLEFLDNHSQEYEIIDISHSSLFWEVTYKKQD